jgi:hypothetical protein
MDREAYIRDQAALALIEVEKAQDHVIRQHWFSVARSWLGLLEMVRSDSSALRNRDVA